METVLFIATIIGGMVTVALAGVQFIWKNNSEKPQDTCAPVTHPQNR